MSGRGEHDGQRMLGAAISQPEKRAGQNWKRIKMMKHIMSDGEEALLECSQSKFHSISPASVIATTRRMIIVRPSFWGLYAGRRILSPTKYNIIPYSRLTSATLSRGKLLSTVSIGIHGFSRPASRISRVEIRGVRNADAEKLHSFLKDMLHSDGNEEPVDRHSPQKRKEPQEYDGHTSSGISLAESLALVDNGSKFVWLGSEPLSYVSTILSVDKEKVIKSSMAEINKGRPEELERFADCIFVCYQGKLAERAASFLKRSHGIDSYILEGGITDAAHEYFTRPA